MIELLPIFGILFAAMIPIIADRNWQSNKEFEKEYYAKYRREQAEAEQERKDLKARKARTKQEWLDYFNDSIAMHQQELVKQQIKGTISLSTLTVLTALKETRKAFEKQFKDKKNDNNTVQK